MLKKKKNHIYFGIGGGEEGDRTLRKKITTEKNIIILPIAVAKQFACLISP